MKTLILISNKTKLEKFRKTLSNFLIKTFKIANKKRFYEKSPVSTSRYLNLTTIKQISEAEKNLRSLEKSRRISKRTILKAGNNSEILEVVK